MATIIQNPFFQVIILVLISSTTWYFLTDEKQTAKRKTLDIVTDSAYYFIFSVLGINVFFNIEEVLEEPYRALIFSSTVSFSATLFVLIFLFYKYRRSIPQHKERIDSILDYFLILGLFNHLFYYYKYQNIMSVVFILTYFLIYFFQKKWSHFRKAEYILLLLGILHGLFLYLFGHVMIYYQIIFYPYQIVTLFLLTGALLLWLRRDIHRN